MNNIIKHSQAKDAKIEIKKNIKYVTISISDSGIGFDKKSKLKEVNGLGLTRMIERVKLLNGNIKINSELNKGTNISFRIPI